MKKFLIIFIVISISTCYLYSQNKTIKGRVINEYFDTLSGVLIMLNDKVEVARTDKNGFFQIDIPISEKKILFWYPGFELTTIELVEICDKIEVIMIYSCSYDFITLKRVDRLRKKRYKKIPEIHKQAFEKGIFKTESPCYKREFEPIFLNKD